MTPIRRRPVLLLAAAAAAISARPAADAAGLLAPVDRTLPPLRVTDHLVDVTIREQVAKTTLTQTFHNDTDQRLEATYVFPLPEEADLTDFQMTFNGKMIQGRVLPAEEARRIYESIVRQSKDPGLIEFIGRRLLQMRVFPIEPRSDTTIQISFQQVCRPVSGMHAYHYPLHTTKAAGQAYGTVRLSVDLQTAAPLKNIWSPTHAVEIVRHGEQGARIGYEASGASLNDDFLLLYATDSSDLGLSALAHKPRTDHDGHFVLILTPRQLWADQEVQPQDVVFVLDTSGSMAGEKLEQARAALRSCIDQLGPGDRFSVVRFSTGFDVLSEKLLDATAEHRARAREWVGGFTAAGGTNIDDTLVHVLGMRPGAPPPSGDEVKADRAAARPFVVVFLTDGRGNRQPEDTLKALAATGAVDASNLRLFTFGVGHDVNTLLLDRLAATFRGKPTYVQPGENLELVMGDFFAVISRPVLTGLRLELPEIGATERFPAALPDLYHGQQLVLAGKFTTPVTGPVRLSAVRNGTRVEYAWPAVGFAHNPDAAAIPSVWAGRKIAYLIDQIRLHGESAELINEVLALSQQYSIQTPYSSWLVDPERPMVVARERGLRVIPNAPGGSGMGGGAREAQADRLYRLGAEGGIQMPAAAAPTLLGDVPLSQLESALASGESAGKAATVVAGFNATLRDAATRDALRLDPAWFARQQIGAGWYNRIGAFLVDERIDEKTPVTLVRFGSDAYFELIAARADLRPVFARSAGVFTLIAGQEAILVVQEGGLEQLTDELRARFQIAKTGG
jgi:Ca-activated chloride channel family protein